MTTPEELLARDAQKEIRATELRGGIVRAERWERLFPSPEEAQADFQRNIVDGWRFYYGNDGPTAGYVVEPNSEGDIHRVVRGKGHDQTFQRLLNGDVVLTYHSPDKPPKVDLITPGTGNFAHQFTSADVTISDMEIDSLLEDPNLKSGRPAPFLFTHLRGKPATQGWEDTMLYDGYMPQRIGHMLFPGYAIEALAILREEHPQFAVKP